MIWVALASLLLGVLGGRFIFTPEIIAFLDATTSVALKVLVLSVGLQVGSDKEAFRQIRKYGWKVMIIPLGVVVGSIGGGLAAGYFLGLPANISSSVSAGFGWYSLSAVLLKDLAGAQVGTTAFLCNVFRELLALMCTPFVAKYIGYHAAIAPGGATAMDTCLPIITRYTNDTIAVLALLSGVICTFAVPFLVPLLFQILPH